MGFSAEGLGLKAYGLGFRTFSDCWYSWEWKKWKLLEGVGRRVDTVRFCMHIVSSLTILQYRVERVVSTTQGCKFIRGFSRALKT